LSKPYHGPKSATKYAMSKRDSMNRSIWAVDSDESTRSFLSRFLSSCGFSVTCFESGAEMLCQLASARPPSALLLDVRLPDIGGLEVLAELTKNRRHVPTIVLSTVEHVGTVVKAIRLGAADYLVKPLNDRELETAIRRVIEENEETGGTDGAVVGIAFATSSPVMRQVQAVCDQVAGADVPVLILGESGVGKEVLARYIHAKSGRPDSFVRVNCAALPTELLESELFGHERGAFTGAQREKPGKFELAGKGTIMLDEIAEMSPLLQAKLLHVVQDGEYARLGATRSLQSEARIIAATNKNLESLAGKGEFREDLYFRLNVITVELPPLRERKQDIPGLCSHFVQKYQSKYKSTIEELPGELITAFMRCPWPGNVRQLENAVKRFLILPNLPLALSDVQRIGPQPSVLPPANPVPNSSSLSLKELSARAAEQAEKELILRTLAEMNWNRKQTAKRLNICYKSLLNKLHRWQLRSQPETEHRASPEDKLRTTAVGGGI